MLELASPDKRTHWFTLVDRGWHKAEATVRDDLEALGDISSTRRKVLGVFPSRKVRLVEPAQLTGLRENVRNAVLLDRDPASVPVQDAILAALAADGDVYSVFSVNERWHHRKAFSALGRYVDGVLPGLRTAAVAAISARRTPAPTTTRGERPARHRIPCPTCRTVAGRTPVFPAGLRWAGLTTFGVERSSWSSGGSDCSVCWPLTRPPGTVRRSGWSAPGA